MQSRIQTSPAAAPSRARCTPRPARVWAARARSGAGAAPGGIDLPDGRQSFFGTLQQLVSPRSYQNAVLAGRDAAVGSMGIPFKDTAFIGSLKLAKELLGSEDRAGVGIGWPPVFVTLIGERSVSMTADAEEHAALRALMLPFFAPDAVAAKMPGIQATARRYIQRWAEASKDGPFSAYEGMKAFTFNVLVNQVLELDLPEDEVAEMSRLFQVWGGGFAPPSVNLPFTPYGKGLAARAEIRRRILDRLASGRLPEGGFVAALQGFFGPDAPEGVVDNCINIMFAGHETSSASLSVMLDQLAGRPDLTTRLSEEQAAAAAAHGPDLGPSALAAMPLAAATVRETLRVRPIVPGVMRRAERDIQLSTGGSIPSGCPFLVALSTITEREPAFQDAPAKFRPERFLADGGAALAPQPAGFNPFGIGTRFCLGYNLALAEMTALLAELARTVGTSHSLEVARPAAWAEFPALRPDNGLPTRLVERLRA